ncbi:methionine ABC transporter ATP-binding protein [Rhizobium sp. LjRoot30]|uniref:methionine ABC transporter ATP-binding protein n=1 Tax=Rhizobium sp. LjRoot30 TaxID=3342320 RepID=UPI003ECC5133
MSYQDGSQGTAVENATGAPVVELVDVQRHFGATPALDGVSLSVQKGEILGIIGRSGAGKSTLIRCLNGLERPDSGSVIIEGQDIAKLPESALHPLRRRIGMIFQHFNLLSAKTVIENVALPLKIEGRGRAERLTRAAELLDLVGLSDKRDAYPAQLSGGQKQRVGIARALAARPSLLLSDEATSALDPETTRSILDLLKRINRELGLTVVLITHEMEVVRAIGDRVAVIDKGKIVEEGPVWSVFSNPAADITRRLLAGILPELPAHLAATLPPGTRLVQVDFAGNLDDGRLVLDRSSESRAFRILHGGVDYVQERPVGRFFIAVNDTADLDPFLATVRASGARAEVLVR